MNRKKLKELAESIAYAVIAVILLYILFWPLKIEGLSMQNTIMSGDRVVISRALKYIGLERGDIVLCRITEDGAETEIIKRLIALPTDHIKLSSGKVYVNDVLLEENYVKEDAAYEEMELTLGKDEYFVMGDNREVSYDSRIIGPLAEKDVLAKYLFTWYSAR